MTALSLRTVSKTFADSKEVLRAIDFDVARGEWLTVVGPSGSGKTTLLRTIAGLETVSAGSIRMDGRDVTNISPHARKTALVFQHDSLFPHLSVRRNLAFSQRTASGGGGWKAWWPRSRETRLADDRAIERIAKELGIFELLDRMPERLSGGEKQRVALGRARLRNASLLLLDEPFAHLDPPRKASLLAQWRSSVRSGGEAVVCVTHDPAEALQSADRIAVLENGCLKQIGTPEEIYDRPVDRATAEFFSPRGINMYANLPQAMRLFGGDSNVDYAVRREDWKIGSHGEKRAITVEGKIIGVRFEGDAVSLEVTHVDSPNVTFARVDRERTYEIGSMVELACPLDRVHRFDRHSGKRINDC